MWWGSCHIPAGIWPEVTSEREWRELSWMIPRLGAADFARSRCLSGRRAMNSHNGLRYYQVFPRDFIKEAAGTAVRHEGCCRSLPDAQPGSRRMPAGSLRNVGLRRHRPWPERNRQHPARTVPGNPGQRVDHRFRLTQGDGLCVVPSGSSGGPDHPPPHAALSNPARPALVALPCATLLPPGRPRS